MIPRGQQENEDTLEPSGSRPLTCKAASGKRPFTPITKRKELPPMVTAVAIGTCALWPLRRSGNVRTADGVCCAGPHLQSLPSFPVSHHRCSRPDVRGHCQYVDGVLEIPSSPPKAQNGKVPTIPERSMVPGTCITRKSDYRCREAEDRSALVATAKEE